MSGNEEFPFSRTLTDFNSLYRCILVENEYLKNKKEYLKKSCTEYDTVTNYIIYLEALLNEKISRDLLIDDNIERGRNTQLILKELKINLLKELEMEQDRTAKQKAKYDFLISKYEATLEHYEEIFNKLPLSCERKKLKLEFQLKHIQLMQLKVEIKEIKHKSLLLEQVQERRKHLAIVKLAEAYKDREAFSEKNAAVLQEVRKLRAKIKAKTTEKQKLMYIMTKDRAKWHIEQDSMSTVIPDFIIDMPSLSIPQLQLPSWYYPPKKISRLEQRSRNNTRCADAGTDTSVPSQSIDNIMTTGVEDILNPVFGFQIRGPNNEEVTTSSLPKSMVATQDSSAAKSTQKNQEEESPQAAADSTATKDNSNAIHCCKPSLPGSNKIPALAMIQPQQKLASDEHMDQALAVTSFKEQTGQRSSVQADASAAEKNPASLTHQTATKTAVPTTITTTTNITTDIATATAAAAITSNTPTSTTATATATTTTEVTDVRAAGMDILGPTVQAVNVGKKVEHNGHSQEAPVNTVNQPVSDHTVLTSQECTRKTLQIDMPPSQVQLATNTEDGDTDMSANDVGYLSPITDETMSAMDQTSEVGQCQEDYHFIASPEVRCSPLSPKGDFLMTSQDETPALKSPPFVISPTIHTTNNDLFGASSNQQSKTGFAFNFGALNTGGGSVNEVAERGKPSHAFQFSFNKKTSSGSLFKLF